MGCSRSVGGFDGCHAEYVRVPFADVNVFPIPNDISDKEALLVADVASTGLHANVLADVKAGDRVVVIGCGAVGLMTQMWAKQRGASMIVAIDSDQQRLTWAKERLGSMPLNSREEDILEAVASLIPGGPDKVIDCVGCSQSSEGFLQKLQMALKMQTDSPNIVNLAIKMVRKNGRITLIGNYVGTCNNFNIGGLMEKHLTINGGQVMPQTYQKEVMDAISSKKINPSMLITHSLPLSKLDEAYRMFDKHEGGMLKPLIVPDELYRGENVMKSTVSQ